MEWPEIHVETGEYATENTLRLVLQRAAEAAIADITEDHTKMRPLVRKFKRSLASVQDWSLDYRDIFEEFISVMAAATSNDQALDMAQAGVDTLRDELVYRLDGNTIVPVKDIFILTRSFVSLETVEHRGTKPLSGFSLDETHAYPFNWVNPLQPENAEVTATHQVQEDPDVAPDIIEGQNVLRGHDACAQIDKFFKYGFMENSGAALAKSTIMTPDLSTLTSNKVFVLLGVTSELGPAKSLLQIEGCTVLGVCRGESGDKISAKKLEDLVDFVTFHAPDNTTLKCIKDGADLITQGPQITQWILDNTSPKQEMVICPLASSSIGEENMRIVTAMDCIIQRICRQRTKTILSQYISPASVMVLPPSAATSAQQRLERRPAIEKWASTLSNGNWCKPSVPKSNNDYCIVNGIVTALGPEYSMAKLLQQWRCMITYYRENRIVATPFAPPTKTLSMREIPAVAVALEGMRHFEPMIALDAGCASTLMAAVMLSQIQFMNRPLPDMEENPFTLFWDGAVHGGVWSCPYSLESLSTINWMLGKAWYTDGKNVPDEAVADCARHDRTPEEKEAAKTAAAQDVQLGADGKPKDRMERAIEILQGGSEYGKPMPECVKERLEFM